MKRKNKDLILACLIKRIRVENGHSTTDVARKLHVTQQYVSELEKGRKSMNPSVFNDLISSYDIKYTGNQFQNAMEKEMYQIAATFLYNRLQIREKMRVMVLNENYKYSVNYHLYVLVEYLYALLTNNAFEVEKDFLIEQIDLCLDEYNEFELLLLYAISITYNFSINNYDYELINDILNQAQKIKINSYNEIENGLYAIINLSMTLIYEKERQLLNITKCLNVASDCFRKALMIRGYLFSQVYLAGCYIIINKVEDANTILNHVNLLARSLNQKGICDLIVYQKAVIAIVTNHYDVAIKELSKFTSRKDASRQKLLLVITYIFDDKLAKAEKVLELVDTKQLDKPGLHIYETIKQVLFSQKDVFALMEIANSEEVGTLIIDRIITLSLIIHYCQQHRLDCVDDYVKQYHKISFSL